MKDAKNLSDEKVVELVVNSDKDAYGILVKRYEEKLMRYAKYLVRDEAIAADVVQDAFIKAYVNLKGFDTKRKFSSWIYRIVHNEAINKIKRGKKIISLESIGFSKKLAKEDDQIEKLNKKEIKVLIDKGLNKLDVKYKEPIALFFLEEKSYEEISDILRLPIGTVGTRITRGKKKLAEIVSNMGNYYGKKEK